MRFRLTPFDIRGCSRTVLLSALTVVSANQPATLQAQTPAGPEFHVNTYTTYGQLKADVAIAKDGRFVVTWESYAQDGDCSLPPFCNGIFAQRYDRAGNRAGAEFQVNTYTTDNQVVPHAAADAKGNFVVVWTSYGQDGDVYGIFGRRYDASGNPRGGEFQVNTFTTGNQGGPSYYGTLSTHNVSMNASGSFVVVWNGNGPTAVLGTPSLILARRYDRSGNAIGAEFRVNQNIGAYSRYPANKLANDGSFVVVWNSPDASFDGVFGRRFNASGGPIGGEFQVNQYVTGVQQDASVDFTGTDGSFVVTWNSEGGDPDGYAVMARRFDGSGNAVGAEFRVNTYTTGNQYGLPPKVRADEAGNFVVAWASNQYDPTSGGPVDVFGQRFAANGTPRGAEFRVNTYTTSFQDIPHLDVDPAGNFVVAWRSFSQLEYGGSVFAQRFGGLFPTALRVDTAANGVWEPNETLRDVRPTWRNHVGASQAFTGTLSGMTAPAGVTASIADPTADYGTVADNASGECTVTANCYTVSNTIAARPSIHIDASALESLAPDTQGQRKRWSLHIGESFTDVPPANGFYRFVETLLHHQITGGCGGGQLLPEPGHLARTDGRLRPGREGRPRLRTAGLHHSGVRGRAREQPILPVHRRAGAAWRGRRVRGRQLLPDGARHPRADGGVRAGHAGPGFEPAGLRAARMISPTFPRPARSAAGSRSCSAVAWSPGAAALRPTTARRSRSPVSRWGSSSA